jgi:hypothetical protein
MGFVVYLDMRFRLRLKRERVMKTVLVVASLSLLLSGLLPFLSILIN